MESAVNAEEPTWTISINFPKDSKKLYPSPIKSGATSTKRLMNYNQGKNNYKY